MSEQLEDLAVWTTHLIRASYDYREHCCEFSKFLVQDVSDDYWPDVAAQLIVMLDDIDTMNKECSRLLEPLKADLVKAVAQLNLPRPEGHLSWTMWIVEHWLQLAWRVKLGVQSHLSAVPSDPDQWFHQTSYQVRREPEKCKDLSRYLFSLAQRFVDFEDKDKLINLVRAECLGVHSIASAPQFVRDCPIRWRDIEVLCVGKLNRVGECIAESATTVRGWRYAKGWPNPMTWQSVRKWVDENKSYDFKDPPEDC